MLEVFINSILYVRQVYPAGIFRKRKMYNTVVFISIYPKLTEYITKVLAAAQHLKKAKNLHKVELVICKDDEMFQNVIEKYVFEVDTQRPSKSQSMLDERNSYDKYLIEHEEQLRKSLISLDQKAKNLRSLKNDQVSFRINLETSQSAFVEITNNSKLQVSGPSQASRETSS